MRVISGQYRGRRLIAPSGDAARPTTDRVKEALFGALQFRIAGMRVLDAFAGSGALGIEALSRGAAHVDFVEKDRKCQETIQKNIDILGAQNCRLHKGDVISLLPTLGCYDLLLADPPYDNEAYLPLLEAARTHGNLRPGAVVVLEARKKFDFVVPLGYNLTKRSDYGDITLWFLEFGDT